MTQTWPGWMALFLVALAAGPCTADEIQPADISRRIDQRLGINDAEGTRFVSNTGFLRRVTLDLVGRIPSIAEVHDYDGNTSESRRSDAIRRLMHSGIYYRNMATFWRRAWVPQADTREFAAVTDDFELWVGRRLQERAPYDELVREILTLDLSPGAKPHSTPIGFYEANQSKPENLAASSTRAFLGINLDCAQCHNHPFSRWTREQFWQTAAFFARPTMNVDQPPLPPKVRVPDTELDYQPVLLTKDEIDWPQKLDSVSLRRILVNWMQQDQERLLAKNAVNRLWSHFFGEAIIEPMDDLSRDEFQTGDRADLLNELAAAFIASGYNLDVVVEGIVGSNAYRLKSSSLEAAPVSDTAADDKTTRSSQGTSSAAPARFQLVQATVRGLTGEQLYDSLQTAAGLPAARTDVGGSSGQGRRRDFAATFYVERTHSAERSISQALALMNGSLVNGLSTSPGNQMLASVLNSPFMSSDEQIDTIYIATLGRHAEKTELQVVKRHFESSPEATRDQHLGNLFWVLVNSAEFNTNH